VFKPFERFAPFKAFQSGEAEWEDLTLGSPLRRLGRRWRKIKESPVRPSVSSNSLGSLTIMERGGGQRGDPCKTAEIVLVFYDPAAYSI